MNDIELVKKEVGYWNTDVQAGWDAGLLGKYRPYPGSGLRTRTPPDHLLEPQNIRRYTDWKAGQGAAERYRMRDGLKSCHFHGYTPEKEIVIKRKGYPPRGPIVTRMEQMGVRGDVTVYYFVGGTLVRTVKCGI